MAESFLTSIEAKLVKYDTDRKQEDTDVLEGLTKLVPHMEAIDEILSETPMYSNLGREIVDIRGLYETINRRFKYRIDYFKTLYDLTYNKK